MAELPLVSIVTPSYNQGDFLEQAIVSVLNQDYPRIEYILIDGGSDDGSQEIIRRYAHRLAYWESQPDRGQAHAINKGLERSRGEIVGWLNSDDLLLPDAVSQAVATFSQRPQVDVVYGRLHRIDHHGRSVPTPLLPKDKVDFDRQHAIGECVVNQPGSFWRRHLIERIGLLNESLNFVLDYEYWVRILLAGGRFEHLPQPVACFRLSPTSKTVGQTTAAAGEHLGLIDKWMSKPDQFAASLGISVPALQRQAHRGQALISLYAFYGCVKHKEWAEALNWLARAHSYYPLVLFQRRWFDLAFSGLVKRFSVSTH